MKKIVGFILLCFVIQITQSRVNAQTTAEYEGLTYYLDKEEAFNAAREQGKQVILFWGTDQCSRCNQTKKNLADELFTSLLEENYILWYCKTSNNKTDSLVVVDYFAHLDIASFPTIGIIDMFDTKKAHGLTTGRTVAVSELNSLLRQYVSNDIITESIPVSIYTNDNSLIIENSIENETISIYTLNGSIVEKFTKTELSIVRSVSGYPKGILFITSSSGWTQKVVIK